MEGRKYAGVCVGSRGGGHKGEGVEGYLEASRVLYNLIMALCYCAVAWKWGHTSDESSKCVEGPEARCPVLQGAQSMLYHMRHGSVCVFLPYPTY